MRKHILAIVMVLFGATSAFAQGVNRGAPAVSGDLTANLTLQETDDGSIAGGQAADAAVAFNQAWDGTVWRRITFGTAGTAATQVWTVQGIASMTPLQVQSNSANIATESTASATVSELQTLNDSLSRDCNQTVPISASSSGNNQLLALSSGKEIVVCGVWLNVPTDVTVQFIYGTGTACATGETDLTGAMPMGSTNSIRQLQAAVAGGVMFIPASQAFCIELSSAVAVTGWASVTQFTP